MMERVTFVICLVIYSFLYCLGWGGGWVVERACAHHTCVLQPYLQIMDYNPNHDNSSSCFYIQACQVWGYYIEIISSQLRTDGKLQRLYMYLCILVFFVGQHEKHKIIMRWKQVFNLIAHINRANYTYFMIKHFSGITQICLSFRLKFC